MDLDIDMDTDIDITRKRNWSEESLILYKKLWVIFKNPYKEDGMVIDCRGF